MAVNYKNIVITPNIGSSSDDPKIVFSGANTTVNTDITLRVYPTSNGTLSFEGAAGQLFSITNDLTGSIFSVNDVSGIPSIDVNADGSLYLAPYSGNVAIGSTTTRAKLTIGSLTATSTASPNTIDMGGDYSSSAGNNLKLKLWNDGSNFIGLGVSSGQLDYSVSTGSLSHNWYVAGTKMAYINNNGLYAPILYDSNNTAYYSDPASTSVLNATTIGGHTYTSFNAYDILLKTSAAGTAGILLQDSSGAFRLQLYGDGTSYGFLNAAWNNWDLQKTTGGNLYLNSNTTYYLNPASTTNLNGLTVAATITGSISGSANNTTYLNGQLASYYTNATNITTGTLPYAQIPANIVNTSAAFTISGIHTYNANVVISNTAELIISTNATIYANGSAGTSGQVLTSNATTVYWSTPTTGTVTSVATGTGLTGGTITTTGTIALANLTASGISGTGGISAVTVDAYGRVTAVTGSAGYVTSSGVTSVATGSGLTGGTITTTGTLSVLANTGIVANATGLYVNATYIGTISANNSTYVGGYAPSVSSGVSSRVVVADVNGYIFNTYLNTTDDINNGTISYIMAKFGDNYYRSATAAKVAAFISGQSFNTTGSANNSTYAYGKTEGNLNVNSATYATTTTTQSSTGSTNFSIGTLLYSANGTSGRAYEAHDFNTYPNLYSTIFINSGTSSNVPSGFSGMGYRFIMGAGDTSTRGFDLVGASEPALWFRERSNGTWNKVLHNNNYNSYSPTLTGGGASGTWNITANNASYLGGTAAASYLTTSSASSIYLPLAGGTLTGRVAQSTSGFVSATKDNISTRTDSGFYQTNWASTANGWPVSTGSWYHLLSSTHTNDANYFAMQFAGSFFDSNELYYRSTNGSGTTGWNKIYHSGNFSSGALTANIISSNTTAVKRNHYVATASLTLTLPASPSVGDVIGFQNSSQTITCIIARNGSNIMSLAEDMKYNRRAGSIQLIYADATRGWVFL